MKMAKRTQKTVVDEVQEEETKAVEEGFANPDEEVLDLQKRKAELIDKLIGDAEEEKLEQKRIEEEAQPPQDDSRDTPSTEPTFDRGGAAIAGPFGRRRLRPISEDKKAATPDNPRRGVQRIWKDRPINNVGQGTYRSQGRRHK